MRIDEYFSSRSRATIALASLGARCTTCGTERNLAGAGVEEAGERTSYFCPECGSLLVSLIVKPRDDGGFDSLLEIPGVLTIT